MAGGFRSKRAAMALALAFAGTTALVLATSQVSIGREARSTLVWDCGPPVSTLFGSGPRQVANFDAASHISYPTPAVVEAKLDAYESCERRARTRLVLLGLLEALALAPSVILMRGKGQT